MKGEGRTVDGALLPCDCHELQNSASLAIGCLIGSPRIPVMLNPLNGGKSAKVRHAEEEKSSDFRN